MGLGTRGSTGVLATLGMKRQVLKVNLCPGGSDSKIGLVKPIVPSGNGSARACQVS